MMILCILEKHLLWSHRDANGGTTSYYYYDQLTWIAGAVVLALLAAYFISRYLHARALRRRPRRTDFNLLKRVIRLKRQLSSQYLRPGFSNTIHAVGIGRIAGTNDYAIQVFVSNLNDELWIGSGAATLPADYFGVPLVLIEMPRAGFLAADSAETNVCPNGIRERQEVIVGGISGAHTNLTGESGTIGYFCTRKSKLPRRKEVHLLSNSHVFADLRKAEVEEGDLIVQPSPGESSSNRPVGSLVSFSTLKFDGDPNHVDAAIAKLWGPQKHKPVIPMIGAVQGYVEKKEVELGEVVRKFGRTTGYTEGTLYSIYLDIWIRYDRVGKSALFQDQFLIEPAVETFSKFVAKGDSGSLVVDANQHAIGLLFGGMAELPESASTQTQSGESGNAESNAHRTVQRIEGYGVANPISEVLERLKIDLLV
jgi:hypothetical protein